MFVKVRKLKSLSFLPVSVKNSFCNVRKSSPSHHSLPGSYSRGPNTLPLPPLLVWAVGTTTQKAHFAFLNLLDGTLDLVSDLFPSKYRGTCFGKTARLKRWYGHKCPLACTLGGFEVLQNQLSEHRFSWKHMRWNSGSQGEFTHQFHPLYLRSK